MTQVADNALQDFRVADLSLAEFGRKEITLAEHEMPGLMALRREYGAQQPLRGRADHRLAAHDDPDRGADRDARRSRRRGALGLVQHLLDPGSRGGRGRRRSRRHARVPQGIPVFAWKGETLEEYWWCTEQALTWPDGWPEHAPRRRRRRHPARPQGCRVRARGRGAGSRVGRLGGVPDRARGARAVARGGPDEVDADRRGDQGRDRGDDDRRAPPLPDGGAGRAPVPGDQRERLGDQEQVRQPLRLPALARRRDQPRRRPDARRQGVRRSAATATWARAPRSRCARRARA